jgi:RNA polymerase sigma-70 factor (ECF subfamily)
MAIFESIRADAGLCDADELVRLVKSGDREALDRMTRCYGARLLAVGRKHCGDDQRAQDAVQDALLSAAEHLDDFRGDGSLQGWLIRMVANACRRMHRGRKNDPNWHAEGGADEPGDEPSPDEGAAQVRLAGSLSDALARLGPDDRALVLLADVESWRSPEIAEALSMTPGQVRTRLSRARRRLRDELAPVWREWAGDPA